MSSRSIVVGVLSVGLFSSPVLAHSGGMVGYSGVSGATCANCHSGGANPTVQFIGPTTVTPGSVNTYAFVIRGGPAAVGGLNLAVNGTADLLSVLDASLQKSGRELTHKASKAFTSTATGPEVRFDFSVTAPATEGAFTLYGAGNSANNNRTTAGDGVAASTLAVQVRAETVPDAGTEPDAGSSPDAGTEPDSGTAPDSGTSPDAGTPPDSGTPPDAGTGTGSPDAGSGGEPPPGNGQDDGGGCSSTAGAPMLSFVLGVAALIRLRRRRA
ncbi:MXAN_6652 family MXYO-CTERM-anchored protein [Archangium primigenium]|uniref:MXAN_6652 family MXYO-CTERM-anchored protein n=1 Tax=[Archangium] primigenium TaxID=2792470 RepID=UPI001EF862DF|nr:MXAN_6652 family MXYO-CTERM-anchored protein [Archangium primigenium]